MIRNLVIVGHALDKFDARTTALAKDEIALLIIDYAPDVVISGRSPLRGVDIWAIEIAKELEVDTHECAPRQHTWEGEYGYKTRNLDMAHRGDLTACVVVQDYPAKYRGRRFKECYHCLGRNPPHVKSGGCYTAWQSKERIWRIVI